ncbi:MAG: MBL fold metallo-hydrolase [Gammaproteobacteria bacterium]|nr:MAG: MBL fold metallo-hydrolase [Gammaproteobacteria bacterium]
MIFRQLFDLTSSTYTYLIGCEETKKALLIDPVFELQRRDLALIAELGLTLETVCETHCHADHVTAAWLLKQKTGCKVASAEVIGASNVDLPLVDGDVIQVGNERLEVLATPGHTDGCLSFIMADHAKAFTGDALLIRGCGRCDFQQGNAVTLFHSVREKLFGLPDSCEVYPGHDYSGRTKTTVAEEKAFNTRLGGDASQQDFVGYMDAMQLPHPRLIDHAVPANMKSGELEKGGLPAEVTWAPVHHTFSGVPEVEVEWVISHRDKVHILDVREAAELENSVDRLENTQVLPLTQLRDAIDEVPTDKPVVCLCRSGRRSAMAVNILQEAGITNVANISGGMLRWIELS